MEKIMELKGKKIIKPDDLPAFMRAIIQALK
jgi:hypothetical protein